MKKKILLYFVAVTMSCVAHAQSVKPQSCDVHHFDSCWYVTMNYHIEKMPTNDELILISHVCCPDTCINDTTRRFQGKRYAKRYARQHGYKPQLLPAGINSFTFAIPEEMVTDTLIGVTYSEYTTPDGTMSSLDTVEIILPIPATLSCHPVRRKPSTGDLMAKSQPYIRSMSDYAVLNGDSAHLPTNLSNHIHFALDSHRFDPHYSNNGAVIDSLVSAIMRLTNGIGSQVESIQIVGYTSPDSRDGKTADLGNKRANALRQELQHRCNLPDSLFEQADGGKHWHMIYATLADSNIQHSDSDTLHSDSLIRLLQNEKDTHKRMALLRNFDGGKHYTALCSDTATAHRYRGTCCTRIYYHNLADSSAHELNKIVAELSSNPNPDYDKMHKALTRYGNDARALNLKGIIEHRRHRRSAAAEAFRKAALLGDEQAMKNMDLLGLSMD